MFKESGLWNEIEKLRGGFDEILRAGGLGQVGRFPAYSLYSRPDEYLAIMELPGVAKENVEIVYRDRQLSLKGNKRPVQQGEGGELLKDETFTGAFERAIPIPTEVDGDRIQARFQDGLLTIRLPKLEKEKPRTVKID